VGPRPAQLSQWTGIVRDSFDTLTSHKGPEWGSMDAPIDIGPTYGSDGRGALQVGSGGDAGGTLLDTWA
jgi:hypothetical protein